jgi:hypothetical protein
MQVQSRLTRVRRDWGEIFIPCSLLWTHLDCKSAGKARVYIECWESSPLEICFNTIPLYKRASHLVRENVFIRSLDPKKQETLCENRRQKVQMHSSPRHATRHHNYPQPGQRPLSLLALATNSVQDHSIPSPPGTRSLGESSVRSRIGPTGGRDSAIPDELLPQLGLQRCHMNGW